MSFLADILFQWSHESRCSTSPNNDLYVPFAIKACWLNVWNVLYEYRFCPSKEQSFVSIAQRAFPYTTMGSVTIRRLPVMSATTETSITNTFRLTQLSSQTAVFEFLSVHDGMQLASPISFTISYQPLRGVWSSMDMKNKILTCLTIHAEDSGLGPLSLLANTIELSWQPTYHSHLQQSCYNKNNNSSYYMSFQMHTIGGFALPFGKTEAMRCQKQSSLIPQRQQEQEQKQEQSE